jgi:enamine deaminase RidA (YjgF/YER057c/UK114 family)
MAGKIDAKLAELGITLPTPMAPIANYVPYVINGNTVIISGQVPAVDPTSRLPYSAISGAMRAPR